MECFEKNKTMKILQYRVHYFGLYSVFFFRTAICRITTYNNIVNYCNIDVTIYAIINVYIVYNSNNNNSNRK